MIYGEKERLVELFEGVHFLLFFVMVIFLVEACRLIVATLRAEEEWMEEESMVLHDSSGVLQRFVQTHAACSGYPWPMPQYFRLQLEKERLRNALVRQRFVEQARLDSLLWRRAYHISLALCVR